jgi:hypothetical protein
MNSRQNIWIWNGEKRKAEKKTQKEVDETSQAKFKKKIWLYMCLACQESIYSLAYRFYLSTFWLLLYFACATELVR